MKKISSGLTLEQLQRAARIKGRGVTYVAISGLLNVKVEKLRSDLHNLESAERFARARNERAMFDAQRRPDEVLVKWPRDARVWAVSLSATPGKLATRMLGKSVNGSEYRLGYRWPAAHELRNAGTVTIDWVASPDASAPRHEIAGLAPKLN